MLNLTNQTITLEDRGSTIAGLDQVPDGMLHISESNRH